MSSRTTRSTPITAFQPKKEICHGEGRRRCPAEKRTLTLPVPAHPRGQVSGAVPGVLELPPELQPLIREILLRLSKHGNYGRGAAAIASLRALVGDLPASANHHPSEPNGLLRHYLEVGLKMVEEVDRRLAAQAELEIGRASSRERGQGSVRT